MPSNVFYKNCKVKFTFSAAKIIDKSRTFDVRTPIDSKVVAEMKSIVTTCWSSILTLSGEKTPDAELTHIQYLLVSSFYDEFATFIESVYFLVLFLS